MQSNEDFVYNHITESYESLIKSITELSYSDTDRASVVELDYRGLKFDGICNCLNKDGQSEKAPDALFLFGDWLYFIEFKYGSNIEKHDIRLKIHEALVTLYNYIAHRIPTITRDQFFSLRIKYAVIERPRKVSSVANPLNTLCKKYQLQNIEGFIVSETAILNDHNQIMHFFQKHTGFAIADIKVASPR